MHEESTTPDLVELNRRAIESATRGDFDEAMSSYGPDSQSNMRANRSTRVAHTAFQPGREIAMAKLAGKRFEKPDEVREFARGMGHVELVDLNGHAVGKGTFKPGWRWSEHVKPMAGTDSCQVEHIGYVVSGRMALKMDDGTEQEFGPGDAFHMPPGHDAWIVGDEACVMLDFGGLKGYAQAS